MSETPGWFIVCWKCGNAEAADYRLEPLIVNDFDLDKVGFGPICAVHYRENDDGEVVYECPTPMSCSADSGREGDPTEPPTK